MYNSQTNISNIIQAIMLYKDRCKNPQQNISKPNSSANQEELHTRSSGIYSKNGKEIQYMQIK
jgi:hypothetical protein